MDPFESDTDKTTSSPVLSTTKLALLIIGIQVCTSLITYALLPDTIPMHWNAAGQAAGYGPKWVNVILFPGLSLGLYVLMRLLIATGTRPDVRRVNLKLVDHILVGVLLFLLVLQLAVSASGAGLAIDLQFIVSLGSSALFILIGNYMGKMRCNFWAGIRTPWTLASDIVWERTHRLGGWLLVAAGILGLFMSFIPLLRVWGPVGLLLLVTLWLVVYSYRLYKKLEAGGKGPASPPFNSLA